MRAAILLAAGASRRFGRSDKLQARLAGRALIEHALANARSSGASRLILVSSRQKRYRGVTVIRAKQARQGMAASLAAGLKALRPIEREVLIFLADMPFARAPRMKLPVGTAAIRPVFRGQPGHPMLVRAAVAKQALRRGDIGLAGVIDAANVRGTIGNIIDIDTPAALRRARLHGSRVAASHKTGRKEC